MADYKTDYSEASLNYTSNTIYTNEKDMRRYEKSKEHEALFNENWSKQKVNINDIVERFAPNSNGEAKGMKYEFKGERYEVIADMSAGYLRIWDKQIKKWIKLDGTLGTQEETHYKIMKREEM